MVGLSLCPVLPSANYTHSTVQLPLTRDYTGPPQNTPYIVAFNQHNCVQVIGLYSPELALAVYNAISTHWPKVRYNRQNSLVRVIWNLNL